MFIFLKLISPAANNVNNLPLLNTIIESDIMTKKLISELVTIKKEFEVMETYFDIKYNILIDIFNDEMSKIKDILSDQPKKGSQNIQDEFARHSSNSLNSEQLSRIFGYIVFSDFLKFYDDCSYSINEQINKIYETSFNCLQNKTKKFSKTDMVHFRNSIDKVVIESVKYRDLKYFRNKLEEKLARGFQIDITDVQSILYGCNSKSERKQTIYIQKYYNNILRYKENCFKENMNIAQFFNEECIKKERDSNQEAIRKNMSDHANYIDNDISNLYKYYLKISETLKLLKTRFSIYEKLMETYKQWNNLPRNFEDEEKALFLDCRYRWLRGPKSILRDHFFKYICYKQESCNGYSERLKQMKSFLIGLPYG